MEKKYMLHFFHERNYEPQSLQAFEREAVQAAQAGATHMYVMDVPKRFEEWSTHPGAPYPNWGMLQTCQGHWSPIWMQTTRAETWSLCAGAAKL